MQGLYLHGLATSVVRGNDTDQQALLEFKAKITGDQLGVMHLWNNTIHFCRWHGVTCSRRHQRVSKLDLSSLKLMGALSPYIGNLSFLRVLNLQNNSFSHTIPQEIGRLHRLQELRLHNNSFVDKLPSNLSNCSKLNIFAVGNNLLVGEIPGVLGSLSNLKELRLNGNKFKGSIPPSLGNLSSLDWLTLAQNRLSGRIPEALGQQANLTVFSLVENGISGMIPDSIFNLSNIKLLDFGHNQFEGSLPSDLGINMPYIEVFSVSHNQFTGSIPASITNASNLFALHTNKNKLSGNLISFEKLDKLERLTINGNHFGSGGATDDLSFLCSLINATTLYFLNIGENNFGGLLPECISNFSSTIFLFAIQENKIFGRIPAGIENLINLEMLVVSNNQLSGSIPLGIGRIQKLKIFWASYNSLSGAIPTSFGNLTMLINLRLPQNNLHGNIPSDLARCENLAELRLSGNKLTGSIPPGVIGLSSLSITLDLSSNSLTGMLPIEVQNLKNLGELNVSFNRLSGVLPSNLRSCVRLEKLYLRGNLFHGLIPSSLSSLKGLLELDISDNNFSGEIPKFLVNFEFLRYLNLSFNDFEGTIPSEGVFKNAKAIFVEGNSKLCGGVPEFHLYGCDLKGSNKRSNNSLKLKVAIASAILGVILVFSFLLLFYFRKKKKQSATPTSEDNSILRLSYQSILRATDGFASENLIGAGSFGSVYKGNIEENGVVVAIKVLNLLRPGASKSFMAECEALKNIRHRNLVRILTACSSIDYEGNDFKALVYEFMVNGSLEDWLHPSVGMNETAKNLTLFQRVNVAADVASALEYLHHRCETSIIHCDLKPSNILLNNEMVGHVGDFVLAKLLSTEISNYSSNQSSSLGLKGTIGYAPPEYGLGNEVSTKGDVYSYGILLLEMFTGKRPTDEMFKEGLSLPNFVKAALPEQVNEIIDPILLEENERHFQYFNSILEIGVNCSAESPNERMDMSDVAAKLCSIKDKLHSTRILHVG
ncbi:hypothetical protein REPUB_Repub13aG0097600 [Reevesia pubescens]